MSGFDEEREKVLELKTKILDQLIQRENARQKEREENIRHSINQKIEEISKRVQSGQITLGDITELAYLEQVLTLVG